MCVVNAAHIHQPFKSRAMHFFISGTQHGVHIGHKKKIVTERKIFYFPKHSFSRYL